MRSNVESTLFEELSGIRHTLMECSDLGKLAEQTVLLARSLTSSQTAAVFLFSKDGLLERRALTGTDRLGRPIPQSWFADERYEPGQSFTGRTAWSAESTPFASPRWTSNLALEEIAQRSRELYTSELGALECAAAVPLHGRHRTVGVLEVINRVDGSGRRIIGACFSPAEVQRLCLVAVSSAAALSLLRSEDRLALLTDVSCKITRPLLDAEEPQGTYDEIAADLTGPLTSYKACIIRVFSEDGRLSVRARSGAGVDWTDADNVRDGAEPLFRKVVRTGERRIVPDTLRHPHLFSGGGWIAANGLRSYVCIPLALKSRVFGAISLFTGYRHDFSPEELRFLDNLAFLIASLSETLLEAGVASDEDVSIANEQSRILSSARVVGYDGIVTEIRHNQKRVLLAARAELESIASDIPGRAGRVIENLLRTLGDEIDKVRGDLAAVAHSRLNLSHIVQQVVKSFARELRRKGIELHLQLSPLPDIEASEAELRDVTVNLLTNAIKAIAASGQKRGRISVETRLGTWNGNEAIELIVQDDGVGIRNEDKASIFRYGFSRYEGGTGVGLFLAQRIVDSYDGAITVDSTVGSGATFMVRLPLKSLRME